eukprot:GEMP01001261.1.p1 GENE.GEMP01001261.1~~GEMP01001261.1.p1  ORF type:complete len:1558 (+),score=383.15 GEMP01001261.1:77-4750(+)
MEHSARPREEEEINLAHGKASQLRSMIQGYSPIKVLMLQINYISSKDLEIVAENCPLLLKIDASNCEIRKLPNVFHKMLSLTCALFHRNEITDWNSVSNLLKAPSLKVVALYLNPVASSAGYRAAMLRFAPNLEGIDFCIVCDDERLIAMGSYYSHEGDNEGAYVPPPFVSTRFSALCAQSEMMISTAPAPWEYAKDEPIVSEISLYEKDMEYLKSQRPKCSAATFIQRWYRGRGIRLLFDFNRHRMLVAALIIQRWVRGMFLRKRATDALRRYLEESGEVDLLLSAQEQIRLRAIKFMQANIRYWLGRRKWQFRMFRSGLVLSRILKGYWVRNNLLRSRLAIKEFPYIYFPAKIAWEMLVALNTVRRRNRMSIFTMEESPFELADVVAIRFPLPTEDMDTDPTTLATLLRARGSTIVRPMRQERFDNMWDGPVHHVRGYLTPAQHTAMRTIARRGRVDNYSRRLFRASCSSGPHLVGRGASAPWMNIKCPEVDRAIAQLGTPRAESMDQDTLDYLEMASEMGGKRLMERPELRSVGTRCFPGFLGTKCFKQTVWLNQPLLRFKLEGSKHITDTLRYIRSVNSGLATMRLRPVMLVVEKDIKDISAAVVIQSTWLARKARKDCGRSFAFAILIRRATITIQRWYRWLPLMKRMALLQTGFRYIRQINTPLLYMEERMYIALNLINSAHRFPDYMKRVIDFGISVMPNGITVVPHLPTHRRMTALPDWFMQGLELKIPEEEEPRVMSEAAHIFGLQDMLLQNLVEPPSEKNVVRVARGVLASAFDMEVPKGYDDDNLRFRLLRFRSVEDARRSAFALYFCTYVVYRGLFAQLLPHSCLRDMKTADASSQIRAIFELNWPAAERAVQFRINRQYASNTVQTVPLHGQRLDLLHIPRMARTHGRANGAEQATLKSAHTTASEWASGSVKGRFAKKLKSTFEQLRNRTQDHKKAQLERLKDLDVNDFFTGGEVADNEDDGTAASRTRLVLKISGTVPFVTEANSGTAQKTNTAHVFRVEKEALQRMIAKQREEELLKRRKCVEKRHIEVADMRECSVMRSVKEQEQLASQLQWTPRLKRKLVLEDERVTLPDLAANEGALTTLPLSPAAARGINHAPVSQLSARIGTAPSTSDPQAWHHPCDDDLEAKRQRIQARRMYRAHRRAETVLAAQFAAGENESARKAEQDMLREDIMMADQRSSEVAELQQRTQAFRVEKQHRAKRRAFHAHFAAARCVVATTCKRVDLANKRTADISEARARVMRMSEDAEHAKMRGALAAQDERDRCAGETRHGKKMNAYIIELHRQESARAMAEKKKRIRAQREVRLLLREAKEDLYVQEKKLLSAVEFEEYEDALRKFKELSATVKRKSMLAGEQSMGEDADESVERTKKSKDWSDEEENEDVGLTNFPITPVIENLFNATPRAYEHAPAPAHTPVDLRASDQMRPSSEDCAQPSGGAEGLITPRQRSHMTGLSEAGVSDEEVSPADRMPRLIPTAPPPLPPLKNVPVGSRDCSPTLHQNHNLPAWSRSMTRVVMEIKKLPSTRLSSLRKIRQTGPFLSAR